MRLSPVRMEAKEKKRRMNNDESFLAPFASDSVAMHAFDRTITAGISEKNCQYYRYSTLPDESSQDLGVDILAMIAGNKNSDRAPKRISKRIQSLQTVHLDHEYNYADTRNCMLRVITFLNGFRPRLVKALREEDRTCAICSEVFRDKISRSSHRPIELVACGHTSASNASANG